MNTVQPSRNQNGFLRRDAESAEISTSYSIRVTISLLTRLEEPAVNSHPREGVDREFTRRWRSEGPAQEACRTFGAHHSSRILSRPHGRAYSLSALWALRHIDSLESRPYGRGYVLSGPLSLAAPLPGITHCVNWSEGNNLADLALTIA